MMRKFSGRFTAILFILIGFGLPGGIFSGTPLFSTPAMAATPPSPPASLTPLAPEKVHTKTNREILRQLLKKHYRRQKLDDALSARIFDRYLSDLDTSRSYFTAKDLQQFEPYRHLLDDALEEEDLTPAFEIFNRYKERSYKRLSRLLKQLENGIGHLDFTRDESIETDRENAPWPRNTAELDELWRKRLKNRVLNLKLSGESDEKITELLTRRFENQLKRIGQTTSEDAFRLYMNALTQEFDPHTQYFSPRLSENFDIMMSLSLEGIGAILQTKNEYTEVLRLVTAGPADKAGQLKPGDRIVGVGQGNGGDIVDVTGWRIDDVVARIRGPKNTVVRLEVIPVDEEGTQRTRVIQITRNTVKLEEQAATHRIETVRRAGKEYRIGVIDLPTFYIDFKALQEGREDYKSTTRDVRVILSDLKRERVDGIVMDLRDNGGGGLLEANELTGLFIEDGPTVLIRNDRRKVSRLYDPDPTIVYDGPLVVLVNRMSASASEIFAAAIQDYSRGLVIGSQTFGKGTIQSMHALSYGQLKLTTGKFYRISGESTQHRGVIPDILFPATYDTKKIGEDALPEALPWDTIFKDRYRPYPDLTKVIGRLTDLYQKRAATSPDFAYLLAGLDRMKELREKTSFSLREETRRKEKSSAEAWRLSVENRLRTAKGETPYASYDEIEETDTEPVPRTDNKKEEEDEPDPLLTECENILVDFITLQGAVTAKR